MALPCVLCVARFPIRNITRALCRRYIMREVGLELMNEDGTSVLFAFRTNYDVRTVPARAGRCLLLRHGDVAHGL